MGTIPYVEDAWWALSQLSPQGWALAPLSDGQDLEVGGLDTWSPNGTFQSAPPPLASLSVHLILLLIHLGFNYKTLQK